MRPPSSSSLAASERWRDRLALARPKLTWTCCAPQTSLDGPSCASTPSPELPPREDDELTHPLPLPLVDISRSPKNSGTGLSSLDQMHKPMDAVIPAGVKRYSSAVSTFEPEQNQVTTADDNKIKCVSLSLPPSSLLEPS